ncbi:MAG: hypothetical protein QG643_1971 [Pseudomonadota bacterium]|nr:hypothetical protein [Pseudomonadota bacterium]
MPSLRTLRQRKAPPWFWWVLGLGLLVLALAVWALLATYRDREQRLRHQVEGELQAIGQLQVRSVAEWRERQTSQAMALADDTAFAQWVARWIQFPGLEQENPVRERLRILEERARYTAAYLLDARGNLLLTPGGDVFAQAPQAEREALQQALAQAEPVLVEPRNDAFFAFPFFSVLVPLYDDATPVGGLWLVTDVRATLFPLLEFWPTRSQTAESFLAQRSGEEVQVLSPLKHRPDAPLGLRLPMSHTDNPAVQAFMGSRGIVYGRDYRGQPVLAAVNAVPDTPWVLVSKVDQEEALGGHLRREWLALSLPLSLVVVLVGLAGTYWQWRARLRERALKQELERNMRWLESAQQAASVGFFAWDALGQEFFLSRIARQIYGLPAAGRIGLRTWIEALHPDDRKNVLARHGKSMEERMPLSAQYRIVRPGDQQLRWVQVWGEFEGDPAPGGNAWLTGTVQDITERKLAEEQLANYRAALETQVRMDPLTLVANRRALDETLASECKRALRSSAPLALLMIDVDHFKAYNDHYGHVQGDQCLRQVAQALSATVGREGELVARYGGEEFAVLLPHTTLEQALEQAERVRCTISALGMAHAAAPGRQHVTVSIGVACLQPQSPLAETSAAAQALLEQADSALYDAKKAGRDAVAAYAEPGAAPALRA